MKLYGDLASPYVTRVVLFARLKGLDLEPEMPDGGIKSDDYLAMNPIGKMPVLVTDDAAIPESEVICEYLEDLHPGSGGLPGGPLDRARIRLVSRVLDVYVLPQIDVLFHNMSPAGRDLAAVETAKSELGTAFGHLEHFVRAEPFAAGKLPTLADCALLPWIVGLRMVMVPAFGVADPTRGSGSLARWWKTIESDAMFGPFIGQYSAALAALMKQLSGQ
jgi:glutathione S-transferase